MNENENKGASNYNPSNENSQDLLIEAITKDFLLGISTEEIAKVSDHPLEEVEQLLEIGFQNYTPKRGKGQRLAHEDRRYLEWAHSQGFSNYRIAKQLRCSQTTVKNELSRCEDHYTAKAAQEDYDQINHSLRKPKKLEEAREFIDYYETQACFKKASPNSVYKEVTGENCPEHLKGKPVVSTTTLYTYIKRGYLTVGMTDLPLISQRKAPYVPPKQKAKRYKGQSIENRNILPEEFGNWELDCVEGPKEKGAPALMTMVEKKTRFGIAIKLKSHTMAEVNKAISALFEAAGDYKYLIFKTITTDNGKEFSSLAKIPGLYERLYFCHVSDPTEKGQVENFNNLLRRFVKKGSRISDYSDQEIEFFTESINDLYRDSLNNKTANICFNKEILMLFKEAA